MPCRTHTKLDDFFFPAPASRRDGLETIDALCGSAFLDVVDEIGSKTTHPQARRPEPGQQAVRFQHAQSQRPDTEPQPPPFKNIRHPMLARGFIGRARGGVVGSILLILPRNRLLEPRKSPCQPLQPISAPEASWSLPGAFLGHLWRSIHGESASLAGGDTEIVYSGWSLRSFVRVGKEARLAFPGYERGTSIPRRRLLGATGCACYGRCWSS